MRDARPGNRQPRTDGQDPHVTRCLTSQDSICMWSVALASGRHLLKKLLWKYNSGHCRRDAGVTGAVSRVPGVVANVTCGFGASPKSARKQSSCGRLRPAGPFGGRGVPRLARTRGIHGRARRFARRTQSDNGTVSVKWTEFALGELLGNAVGIARSASLWAGWGAGIARTT